MRRPSGQQAGQGSPFGPCVMRCCPGPAPPSRSLSAAVSEMILPTFRVAMGISWVKPLTHTQDTAPASFTGPCTWIGMDLECGKCSVVSDSLRPSGPYSPWNSPGQNTGVGSLSLLQGIFPTQGLNPGLPHCRGILYQLRHQGSQRLEWAAYPFSRGSSRPRNQTWVFCTAEGFFTS